MTFFTLVFVVDFLLHAAWVKDKGSPIRGGAGAELWPRKLCTVTFDLEDIKAVKSKVNGVSLILVFLLGKVNPTWDLRLQVLYVEIFLIMIEIWLMDEFH